MQTSSYCLTLFFFISCSYCNVAFTNQSSPPNKTIVLSNHGVLLKPRGLIALNANENLFSIFQKFPIPKLKPLLNCDNTWINQFNIDFVKQAQHYTNLYGQITNPVGSGRKKRYLAAIGIGLGLADFLFSGISYTVLQKHISSVESKFESFVEQQHTFDEKVTKVEDQIVHVIARMQKDINENFKNVQCQILNTSGKLLAYQFMQQWEKKLRIHFEPILTGQITTQLNAENLDPSDLQLIIRDHKFIKDTYFARNVYSLYQVSKLTLVQAYIDIQQNAIILHEILSFPVVHTLQLYPFYQIMQTGIMKNNNCFQLELPHFLYKNGDEFYPLDKKIANSHRR